MLGLPVRPPLHLGLPVLAVGVLNKRLGSLFHFLQTNTTFKSEVIQSTSLYLHPRTLRVAKFWSYSCRLCIGLCHNWLTSSLKRAFTGHNATAQATHPTSASQFPLPKPQFMMDRSPVNGHLGECGSVQRPPLQQSSWSSGCQSRYNPLTPSSTLGRGDPFIPRFSRPSSR